MIVGHSGGEFSCICLTALISPCTAGSYPSIPGPHPGRRAGNRMNSAPNAAFRVDRSPSLCSAGRFDIIELLHGDLHRLRRPQGARRSPEALVSEKRRWSPRPVASASGPRSRFVRPARPSTVPIAAARSWTAAESALERLQGLKIAHFYLTLDIARELPPRRLKSAAAGRNYTISYLVRPEPEPSAAGRLRTRPAGR